MEAKCRVLLAFQVLQWLTLLTSRPTLVLASCPAGVPAHPLLWKVTGNGSTAYLLASYDVSPEVLKPMPSLVQQALNCADAAYFELTCSLNNPHMNKFMRHCDFYDSREEKGTIAERLPVMQVKALQAGLVRLIDDAPKACKQQAQQLRPVATTLEAGTSRITVRALQERALRLLHPSGCKQQQRQAYEESLRTAFGSKKPVYGLSDVGKVCNKTRVSSIQEDTNLATQLLDSFSDKAWRDKVKNTFEAANELMRCGDINGLSALQDAGAKLQLPWLDEDLLFTSNLVIAAGIMRAFQKFTGKTLFIALGAEHCVSRGKVMSTLDVLKKDYFEVQPVIGSQLSCQPSSMQLPAIQPPQHCIEPPDRFQKATCRNFQREFVAALGSDNKYGRIENTSKCASCVGHPKACSCNVEWSNDTAFRQLCANTKVSNVRGQLVGGKVFLLDLTQNPGSNHHGNFTAEKTVYGIQQECASSECDLALLEEVKRRFWFMIGDDQLVGASVSVRVLGASNMQHSPVVVEQDWGNWRWMMGALLTLVVVLCVVALVCWLTKSKPRKKKSKGEARDPRFPEQADTHENGKVGLKDHDYGKKGPEDVPDILLEDGRQAKDLTDEDWVPNPRVSEEEVWNTTLPPVMRNGDQFQGTHGQHDNLLDHQFQSTKPHFSRGQTPETPTDWIGAPGLPPSAPPPPPPAAGNRQLEPPPRPLSSTVSFDHGNNGYPPIHDNSILTKAAELQAKLGDAGAQAVQQIQLHAIRSWQETAPRSPSTHLLNSRPQSFAHAEQQQQQQQQQQQVGSPLAGQMQMLGGMGGASPRSFVTTAPVPVSQQGSFATQAHQQVNQQTYVPPATAGVPYGSYSRLA